MKEISFPIDCTTNNEHLEYLYCAQEKLRLEHNNKGKDYRKKKITSLQWKEYLEKDFEPKSKKIGYETAVLREKLGWTTTGMENPKAEQHRQEKEKYKKSTRWVPDLKEI